MIDATSLEAAIVAIVDARIARVLGGRTHYSDTSRSEYPPRKGGYSDDDRKARRQARDLLKAHPAHERTGRGKATVWRVAVEAYHAPTPTTAKPVAIVERAALPGLRADADALAQARQEAEAIAPTRATRRAS